MAKITLKQRKEKLAGVLAENEGKVLDAATIEAIKATLGGTGAVSHKTNENGEVFCNYFGQFLPAEKFAVKEGGKFESMSIEGKKLFRTQKSMINRASSEVLKQFRAKEISAEDMEKLLAAIETNSSHRFPMGTESIPTDYPFSV